MTGAFETYFRNAEEMAGRAIEAREKIYQGKRDAEAVADANGTSRIIEVQTWMGHELCRVLVADNQWNMKQSIMYSQLAQTRASARLLSESIKQTKLLEQILTVLTNVDKEANGG